ncbi:SDR family NAD(P)-dependent oxidoreductase [Modestobacter versicolor]|uniref:3-oxoacyl-[acyl-carrier protein] reductase n=1 Tax=Modestobacter versicolor TaxID=429133 RepID=A0A323VDJ1_9ACTN|nr:SDR family NAD(P)-dependent oxidoreductase [Modestobacter versicolor]MBB3676008.1 3-oxoacyl-[acyl-carrier protein] reductase [Modestobacter versicolor]PZA22787.1 short-chain dehydrogenase [Modestobacter versicolor]
MSRLAGRRVVVTGAARGIGAEIARTFAAEGARLALLDRLGDEVGQVAAEVDGRGYAVDLADVAATREVTEKAVAELGGVDVLVNNAGILRFAPLLEIDPAEWDEVFAVNARAMLVTTQVAVRAMTADPVPGVRKIVNMASMGGKAGGAGQAHYAASKAAVIALTRAAAAELGPLGITVNCLCPGFVLTEMGAGTRTEDDVRAWSALSPLGRLAQPRDVARAALFLAGEDSDYLTGDAINVTGGMITH